MRERRWRTFSASCSSREYSRPGRTAKAKSPGGAYTGLRGPETPSIPYSAVLRAFRGALGRRNQTSCRNLNSPRSQPRKSALMWARRWPGRTPRHSARPVKAVRFDSEPRALVTAFVRHRETPARQRRTEPTTRDNASSQCTDNSYLMRL